WSPPGPLGFVLPGHLVQPDETEAFVAADGRYAVITGVVGLVAAVALWRLKRVRGPVAALALGVGGLAGAWLTEIVGRALDGGRTDGPVNTLLPHLRLSVHMHGLRILEPLTAMLCYSLCVAFAADDDLGRGDSVGRGGQPERGWGDSHAAGALQQP
ncbi:MAG: hypothetical protein QOG80_2026, partial [Pseudonocardiales bacterium]|nr:hypothetical protein [Pseudonocardiales bacterium]